VLIQVVGKLGMAQVAGALNMRHCVVPDPEAVNGTDALFELQGASTGPAPSVMSGGFGKYETVTLALQKHPVTLLRMVYLNV
jgi:hypothetical protein